MIESCFGLMAAKWRILLRPIETTDKNADQILKAIVGLHNFLIEFSPPDTHPAMMADHGRGNEENGLWRAEVPNPLKPIRPGRGGARNQFAQKIREDLMSYVNTVGRVPWQDDYL